MTIDEYHKALEALTDEKFAKFNSELGGGAHTRVQRVFHFRHLPQHEHTITHLLGLMTEEEKMLASLAKAAAAAEKSAFFLPGTAAARKEPSRG